MRMDSAGDQSHLKIWYSSPFKPIGDGQEMFFTVWGGSWGWWTRLTWAPARFSVWTVVEIFGGWGTYVIFWRRTEVRGHVWKSSPHASLEITTGNVWFYHLLNHVIYTLSTAVGPMLFGYLAFSVVDFVAVNIAVGTQPALTTTVSRRSSLKRLSK